MFGADNLSPVALSVASNNKFSPNSVSRAKTEPILHRDRNNFESVGSASDFDDIDSWIDENIPEHLRTPNAKSHDFSAASDSHILPVNIDKTSYSGNKVHPRRTSYWTQGNNVVNTAQMNSNFFVYDVMFLIFSFMETIPRHMMKNIVRAQFQNFFCFATLKKSRRQRFGRSRISFRGRQWLRTERKDFKVSRKSAQQKPRFAEVSNR